MQRVAILFLLVCTTACSAVHSSKEKVRLETPLEVLNNDTLSLTALYRAPASSEFIRFYRTFYNTFAKIYQHYCPLRACLRTERVITVEEERRPSSSDRIFVITTIDHRGYPLATRRMLTNPAGTPEMTAHLAARWTSKTLMQHALHAQQPEHPLSAQASK